MMKPILILALSALSLDLTTAQDSLTVEQVVRLVLSQHPAIVQADQSVRAAEARVLQSSSALYPDVKTDASYAFLAPIAKLAFPGLGEFKLYPASNYDIHIGGRYTVYDFGKTDATVDLNRSKVRTGRDAVDLTKNLLAYQAIRVFYAILFLEQSIEVQDGQIDALRQHLAVTQRRVSAGTATSFEVLTTEVRIATAQSKKIDLENAAMKQRSVLAQYLSLASGSILRLRGNFDFGTPAVSDDSLLQSASRQRVELKLAADAERSAEFQQKFAALGNKPSLKFNLTYGFKNGYIPNLDVLRGNMAAAVTAEVPIFDGWKTDHQQEEAQAQLMAEQARERDIQQQVRSDVQQAIADVQSAALKISLSELQVRHAEEAVSIARSRYDIGTVTNLDLLDAQTAESEARLGNLQARYKLVMSRYELQRAIGAKPVE